jgi:hypothetical protein
VKNNARQRASNNEGKAKKTKTKHDAKKTKENAI